MRIDKIKIKVTATTLFVGALIIGVGFWFGIVTAIAVLHLFDKIF